MASWRLNFLSDIKREMTPNHIRLVPTAWPSHKQSATTSMRPLSPSAAPGSRPKMYSYLHAQRVRAPALLQRLHHTSIRTSRCSMLPCTLSIACVDTVHTLPPGTLNSSRRGSTPRRNRFRDERQEHVSKCMQSVAFAEHVEHLLAILAIPLHSAH